MYPEYIEEFNNSVRRNNNTKIKRQKDLNSYFTKEDRE